MSERICTCGHSEVSHYHGRVGPCSVWDAREFAVYSDPEVYDPTDRTTDRCLCPCTAFEHDVHGVLADDARELARYRALVRGFVEHVRLGDVIALAGRRGDVGPEELYERGAVLLREAEALLGDTKVPTP